MADKVAFVADERAALSDTFAERGPDEPTLCTGWDTRDLLQHLVLRDAGPARTLRMGKAASKRQVYEADWNDLIREFRDGPPPGSLFRLPGANTAGNFEEFFVHHEDVRRASDRWVRRELSAAIEDSIWRRLTSPLARLMTRRADVGIHIRRPNGDHATLRALRPGAIVTGEPSEILMFLFGRQSAALVELDGPPDAQYRLNHAKLGV